MRKFRPIDFCLPLLLFFVASPCPASPASIEWSKEELTFVQEHPVVRLGVDPGFVPFEFIDADNKYAGIAADYLGLISGMTGLRFEVVKDLTWTQAYEAALSGAVDVLPAVGKTEEREAQFLFTVPYHHFKRVMVTRDTE